ncbi:hypothetical protein [Bordetella petrii]|uniref:hypothetical protein n=1 Tax=Bordetella petrii TaxID=94624 RepID=UPI00047927CC|nr:hypothetical protein [Bordetella petrii]
MNDATKYSSKVLKYRNLGWLVATLVLDVLILLVIAFRSEVEDLSLTKAIAIRVGLTALLPLPALLLSWLVSPNQKAILVFWRRQYPLPGARAFSIHAPADPRIDLAALRRHVGEFPVAERDQNTKWYSLYKLVDSDPSVVDSHKSFLLFRDMAAMSLVLAVGVPLAMYFLGVGMPALKLAAGLFFAQYLLSAHAGRTAGVRFVQNVLAVHASRKIVGSLPQDTPVVSV